MKKKIISILFMLLIVLSLTACKDEEKESEKENMKEELTLDEEKWNKMWDLWTEEEIESPYEELMTYQSEINNGGHSQYFSNVESTSNIKDELKELKKVLPQIHIDNLDKAYKAYQILEKEDNEEAENTLDECDDFFYENEELINEILEERASKIKL